MNRTAAEPPATQLIMRAKPISRLGRFEGGGWGYARGGIVGGGAGLIGGVDLLKRRMKMNLAYRLLQ